MTKVKKKSFSRAVAFLVGGVGFIGLFGSDQMLPFIRWEDYLHHQRELRQLRDSIPHPRGPYKYGFRHLSEMKAKAAKDAADAETSSIVRKIRSGLRSILGDGTIPFSFVDTKRRASNYTILESDYTHAVLFNNFTNETEMRCRFAPVVGPEQIEAVTSSRNFTNTIVVGYPGPDKRIVMRQMEAMTGLSGRDEWDFQYLGMTSQPFIKSNYPHHEGTWGWQDHGDQVILVLRSPRRLIDEYHDILVDINYAKTWEAATSMIANLYQGEVNEDKYIEWRDARVMDEIGWYGWMIDYWMEDGLMRDYFDHKVTTPEHWALLLEPEKYTYGELQWDVNVCADAVAESPLPLSYDSRCETEVSRGCSPVVVVSADRLMDPVRGYSEHRKIASVLNETDGVKDFLVDEVAWDCFYDLMIGDNPNGTAPDLSRGDGDMGTGYHDYRARLGTEERQHLLSTRMLRKIVAQLTRLITKYSSYDPETGIDWPSYQTAIDLVDILNEYLVDVQQELDATPDTTFPHAPQPDWTIYPICGPNVRSAWDYNYPGQEVVYATSDEWLTDSI